MFSKFLIIFLDNLWYRALHIRTDKECCVIMFMDIGNIYRVAFTDIRKMPLHFNASPPMATVSNLAGTKQNKAHIFKIF